MWKQWLSLALVALFAVIGMMIWFSIPRNRIVYGDEFEGVIFHSKNAVEFLGVLLSNEQAEETYWIPKKSEVLAVESQLLWHIQNDLPNLSLQLSLYQRQYYGFVREERQWIFVVGFCETGNLDWYKEFVSFADSPLCYFEAQYDVTKAEFSYIWASTTE